MYIQRYSNTIPTAVLYYYYSSTRYNGTSEYDVKNHLSVVCVFPTHPQNHTHTTKHTHNKTVRMLASEWTGQIKKGGEISSTFDLSTFPLTSSRRVSLLPTYRGFPQTNP